MINNIKPQEPKIANWVVYFAVVTNTIGMMSTDIHLPVLHEISKDLNTSYFATQLILVVFYVVGIIARVTLGPLSDAYGRRKIFMLALDVQIIGQAMQAFAPNIEIMLSGRVIQALASGGLTILISAIISDVYSGYKKTKMLSINEFIQPLGFVLAPIIGGIFATYYGWRSGFIFLLFNLVVARLVMMFVLVETNFQLISPSFVTAFRDYKKIFSSKQFLCYSMIMGFTVASYMSYVVVSSYIYMTYFGLSTKEFMVYQSIPLICQAFIAFSYTKFRIKLSHMLRIGIVVMVVAGIFSILIVRDIVEYSPNNVLICMVMICFALGMIFPVSMKSALELFPHTKGTAASAIVVTRGILSGVGMLIAGYFHLHSRYILFSIFGLSAFFALGFWLYLQNIFKQTRY